MNEYNVKNYTEQGGGKTIIGGVLEFTDDAEIKNFPFQGTAIADYTATTVAKTVEDLNKLIASLRSAGLIASTDVKGLSFSEENIFLTPGSNATVNVVVSPENAESFHLTWKSSDEAVAAAASTQADGGGTGGTITGVAEGTAILTVKLQENENISASVEVIVAKTSDLSD